jgi:hypothetical protein
VTSPDDHPAAQVLFVTVDEPHVRLDVILLDPAVWGRQHLPAGTPISISFDVDHHVYQSPVTAIARAWAAESAAIGLTFTEDDGRQLVIMAAGDERLVLAMEPTR